MAAIAVIEDQDLVTFGRISNERRRHATDATARVSRPAGTSRTTDASASGIAAFASRTVSAARARSSDDVGLTARACAARFARRPTAFTATRARRRAAAFCGESTASFLGGGAAVARANDPLTASGVERSHAPLDWRTLRCRRVASESISSTVDDSGAADDEAGCGHDERKSLAPPASTHG